MSVCGARVAFFPGRSKGTLAGGAAYHPTPVAVEDGEHRRSGEAGSDAYSADMVSRREHNQHVATRGRSPPALVNRGPGNTSVRAPPLFSIAVSRGYMSKRANTCTVCARTTHVVDACEGQTQPPSSSSPFEYARFLLNSAPGSKARACSFRPCKFLTLVLGPLIQRSASYLDCPPLRQRPDVG